jgi:hypothetical protein
VRIYSRRRERFADGCVKETDRFGGGGVMVWGGITHVSLVYGRVFQIHPTHVRWDLSLVIMPAKVECECDYH